MLKPNRSRISNQLRIGADLTPSQLVLAICVFLCAALICFSLGVIVGKYDERTSNREKTRLVLKSGLQPPGQPPLRAPSPGRPPTVAKAGPGAVQGVQTSPRAIAAPPSPGKPGYPESPVSGSVQAGPRVSEHPAPPKPVSGDGRAASTAPAAEPEKQPAVETASAPAAQPGPDANKAEGAAGSPVAESAKAESPKPEPPKAEAKNEPPALEPVVAPSAAGPGAGGAGTAAAQPISPAGKKGLYTVQLASLTSATRKKQALGMKKKLEADGLQPELLISRDGARVSVVVGSYPDRQAAQAACNELRKNKGFSDCFVRTR
ncbi:MAG TPA: SPOR domain-containing protein [Candidatus Bathyarchaeia archaeon]|nr:SPOR domain-containing protein [Candidatus Bathyarchaeia archaeon]